jgi:hypothetical protein
MTPLPQYNSVIFELINRITALIPEHPEIATIEDAWDLFDIPEFNVDDLQPSLFQVSQAVYLVQRNFKNE